MILSLISSIPRILRTVPSTTRLAPSLALSTSSLLKDSGKIVAPHKWPQERLEKADPFDGRYEMAKDGYGVTLYDINDGRRKSLSSVVMRFKRLDWGVWIKPRQSRHKKKWKKSREQLIRAQKHNFCNKMYHKTRFDRAVTSDIKAIRHIPDDPYKTYNDMSFQNYHSIKLKNMELIKKYGAKNYNFIQYRAHFHNRVVPGEGERRPWFEPPNYQNDISSGIYSPDQDRPQDIMAPFFVLERRHNSACAKVREAKYHRALRHAEHWYGRISPCHPLRLPEFGTRLG